MQLKIFKIDPRAKLPAYAHASDAGLDLFSNEEYVLKPGESHLFFTGIKLALPENTVGLVWDKSGLALKYGIKTMAGVIDQGYRGELKILLHNLGDQEYKVEKYSKIAQLLVQRVEHATIEEVSDLKQSDRGQGGFGSTGLK